MRSFKQVLVALLAALVVQQGAQAAAYPERPIRVVVPPAGAAADNAMRVVALKLGAELGQPIVIENKAAVPGILAAAMAQPDGYTFLLGAGSGMVTGPLLKSKLPYDPARDFVPVGRVLINVPILTVHPSLGVRSVQELIALAKQKPGRLDYSSSGSGTPGHLSMEMLQALTGTHMVHIPYKGGAPAVNELMGGHVHLGINALSSVAHHVKSGKLVPLAVASAKRTRALPDVPTMAEAGVAGFEYDIWYALFAPARTPPEIVAKVSGALQRALADPQVVRQLAEQGADAAPTSAQELARFIKEDTARWSKIIKDRNLKVE